jgi:nitrite reductase (cytochrome c-552)
MNKRVFLLVPALAVLALLFAAGCSDVAAELKTPKYKTGLAATETKNSAFGKVFPKEYATWQRNDESTIMTTYKGSVPYRKNDNVNPLPKGFKNAQPYLKNLWLGYPFMYEYNEARGHTYGIHDILDIDRINHYHEGGMMPSACWNCKATTVAGWVKEQGDAFWSKPFNTFRAKDKVSERDHTIGCANCHNPETMELAVTSVPLDEALKRQGKDWRKMSRNEMRSLVCAQCHVEYYFEEAEYTKGGKKVKGVNRKVVFPWDLGMDPAAMYKYYEEHGAVTMPGFEGKFQDWMHPVSKTPMIKVQHPEYEAWIGSAHGAAGVSCADCHMPYTRSEGKKISSHQVTSPLKTPGMIDAACRKCHADKTAEFLKARVEYTQAKAFENLLQAQDMSVKAHEAVRQALEWTGSRHADYDKLIINAKEMVRKGQFFWDWASAENSVGFHNPPLLMDTVFKSMTYSQEAVNYAMQAANYGISPKLEGDVKKIVPPLLEWNRAMHMDPENKKRHVWTTYLPDIPKAERVWLKQDKVR